MMLKSMTSLSRKEGAEGRKEAGRMMAGEVAHLARSEGLPWRTGSSPVLFHNPEVQANKEEGLCREEGQGSAHLRRQSTNEWAQAWPGLGTCPYWWEIAALLGPLGACE